LLIVRTVIIERILEKLHLCNPSNKRYKYPVYRSDDRPSRFTQSMMEKMDEDELWEELKRVYHSED